MTPYAKTGGLADVLGSLPPALAARGHRVMIVTPKYADYEGVEYTGVTVPVSDTQARSSLAAPVMRYERPSVHIQHHTVTGSAQLIRRRQDPD